MATVILIEESAQDYLNGGANYIVIGNVTSENVGIFFDLAERQNITILVEWNKG